MMSSPLFSFLLILLLSADALVFGFSYGMDRVCISPLCICIISVISGLMLTCSFVCGDQLLPLLPSFCERLLPFLMLFLLALYKLYDAIPRLHTGHIPFSTEKLSHCINAKEVQTLSLTEAAFLALTLSVDNIFAGLGTGTCALPLWLLLFSAVATHAGAILLGWYAGRTCSRYCSFRVSLISSLLLFALAFVQLL